MIGNFLNYILLEKLDETKSSLVYRGQKENESKTYIIKVLKSASPTLSEIARFRQEYELIKKIDLDCVIKTYDILEYDNKIALVLQDFNGISLEKLMGNQKIDLKLFLKIAVKIAGALGSIHKKNIIHKDIKPHNILFNAIMEELKIADFGISNEITHENQELYNPDVIEGTLAYMSPEQTGRMNSQVDYRTDMYSLGITFYKMLTERVPFISKDPLEVIHHHMAIEAPPPAECNPSVPPIISGIVKKLLSKIPEERYQNCFGLMSDLKECLYQLETRGNINEFEPGKNDISPFFVIPRILIGREREIDVLLEKITRVSTGGERSGIALVSGHPGIGKSALIHEAYRSVISGSGYFITGKYDQFRRDVPYSAIIQAFQSLVKQILSENDAQIGQWKENLLKALGSNGKVITAVIPEIEFIIGRQPDIPELGPEQNQNRFNYVFGNFIGALSARDHTVALFLDDLQWADMASLNLINLIITDKDIQHFLIIGAYRDDEVDESHSLIMTLDKIKETGAPINTIHIDALSAENVNEMISHFLRCDKERSLSLAELVHRKTNGNPFFVNQFMKTLYDENLLKLDPVTGWQWEMDKIEQMQITDNVAELMAQKITRLPQETQEVMKICACIGNRFDLEIISQIYNKSIGETLKEMSCILNVGMVRIENDMYRFQHDRIQEAAYSLVPAEEKEKLHYRIGNLMLKITKDEELQNKILYIADQLNTGRKLITSDDERYNLARLNLRVGNKAKSSAAYKSALMYFKTGIELVNLKEPDKTWEKQYDLSLSLCTDAAEAAYLNNDYKEAENFSNAVLKNATSILDKVKIYEIQMHANMGQNKLLEAINIGTRALKSFRIRFPKNPGMLHILLGLIKTNFLLFGKDINTLLRLPVMKDSSKLCAIQLLAAIPHAAYWAKPNLVPLVAFKLIELTIKFGNSIKSPFSYSIYGFILCSVGNIEKGYFFGKLSLKLLEQMNIKTEVTKTCFVMNTLIRHWKEPLSSTTVPLLDGFQIGLETGDLEFLSNSAMQSGTHQYFYGHKLVNINFEKYIILLKKIKQITPLRICMLFYQVIKNLQDKSKISCYLKGDSYNEDEMIPVHIKANDKATLAALYSNKILLCYIFQEYVLAYENLKKIKLYLNALAGLYQFSLYYFYDSLTHLALYDSFTWFEKKKALRRISRNRKKIKKWMHFNPSNQSNKFYLVEAERMRALGKNQKAIEFYNKSIECARENGFIQEEGIANERAGEFWLKNNNEIYAGTHMRAAYDCYMRWGAMAKTSQLEKKYADLLNKTIKNITPDKEGLNSDTGTSGSKSTETLDLASVIKASQAISGEIVLEKLLEKMMKIVLENAGAQKGYLILENEADNKLYLEAEGAVDKEIRVLESVPLENNNNLSSAIVQYVNKSKENIVLNNASEEGEFANDPYVEKNRPKSILCGPLLYKGKVSGIIYLENNLITNAFTPERLELLQLLSSQIAISIENAGFYEKLEEKVRERTIQLKEANEKLKELSLSDPLTKLRNRRYVTEIVSDISINFIETQDRLLKNEEMRDLSKKGKVLGIYLIDIDHFKIINDTYGHRAGDDVLVKISAALRKKIRKEDVIVRWGGEEFLIILLDTKPEYLKVFAKKVLDTIKGTPIILFENKAINKTCSLGFSKIPINLNNPKFLNLEQVINLCDFALYLAKENGRDQSVYIELKDHENIDEKIKEYLTNLSKHSKIDKNYIDVQYVK